MVIIAGPNGAGKTSFANAWFARAGRDFVFLNADEIVRSLGLAQLPAGVRDLIAGRRMLRDLDAFTVARRNLVVETTLSTRVHAHRIPGWRRNGYRIELIYLRLPFVELSLARVAHRVAHGGHDIPEADVRRRFDRGLANLEQLYKPLVDHWEVWDSLDGAPKFADRSKS